MNKKTVSIPLPRIEGVELKSATVDLEKGVVVAEYGQEEWQEDREKDISEIATDENSARDYLGLGQFEGLFYDESYALTQLITIAKAWNEFDEFKPDWEDLNQEKYYPLFEFKSRKFEFAHVGSGRFLFDPYTSNFSFKTPERAERFGKQFIDLFRIVLTN